MLDLSPLIEQSKAMPDAPGVYLFKSPSGVILYVGKAVSLRKRTSSYFRAQGQDQQICRAAAECQQPDPRCEPCAAEEQVGEGSGEHPRVEYAELFQHFNAHACDSQLRFQ